MATMIGSPEAPARVRKRMRSCVGELRNLIASPMGPMAEDG